MKNTKRGGVIGIVVLSAVAVAIIAASIVSLINTQRRVNLGKELQLQANTIAEAALDYAFSCVANEVNIKTRSGADSIPSSGYHTLTLPTSALNFLSNNPTAPSGFSGATGRCVPTEIEVRVLPAGTPRRYRVDPDDPTFANDRTKNKWVTETIVPIIAKVTCTQAGSSYTAYVCKPIAIRDMPLFQFSILYSGQLQMHRGYRPLGDIHSNGPLLLNAHDSDNAIYTGFVSTYNHYTRGSTMNNDVGGLGGDAYGYTKVKLDADGKEVLDYTGGVVPKATGNDRIKLYVDRDTSNNTDIYGKLLATFDSRTSNWKEKVTADFKGHLEDASHQVPEYVPAGAAGYRLDIASTNSKNEFNNGPYALIEPLLPSNHTAYKSPSANKNNMEANAALILRVEYDPNRAYLLKDSSGAAIPLDADKLPTGGKTLADAANLMDVFRVKAYKYAAGWVPGQESDPTLIPVTLPNTVIGAANTSITAVASPAQDATYNYGVFEPYTIGTGTINGWSTNYKVTRGLHDARLGRPVRPITLNMSELKRVMEAAPSTLTDPNEVAFRDEFTIKHPSTSTTGDDWKMGVVYFEFPTSLTVDKTRTNTKNGTTTYAFSYGSPETRHPDRASNTDSRPARTDKIVPIAPELRRYPSSFSDSEIKKEQWAIPALQIINASSLPDPYRASSPGFTIATNGPIYLIGNYNSDGNYTTGTNITSTAADAWSTADTTVNETPSIILCDSFTVLSENWKTANRAKSFFGVNSASTDSSNSWGGRKVPLSGNQRLEIGACIATGEYPIFEFFFRALEDWQALYDTGVNPIIIKGAMAGIFHSEIQHIKQAYSRDVAKDIQTYWHAHGAYAIPTVRYHNFRILGTPYKGEPTAYIPAQVGFRLLRRNDTEDAALLTAAGY